MNARRCPPRPRLVGWTAYRYGKGGRDKAARGRIDDGCDDLSPDGEPCNDRSRFNLGDGGNWCQPKIDDE